MSRVIYSPSTTRTEYFQDVIWFYQDIILLQGGLYPSPGCNLLTCQVYSKLIHWFSHQKVIKYENIYIYISSGENIFPKTRRKEEIFRKSFPLDNKTLVK